jgi:hypothetical protein
MTGDLMTKPKRRQEIEDQALFAAEQQIDGC